MTPLNTTRIRATLLAAIVVSACTSAARPPLSTSAAPSITREGGDPAYVAQARADSLRLPYTQADVDFMSGMIGHHAQAIVMAHWAPTHGANASVRRLAERIINAQQDEIASMQRWLKSRGEAVPEANAAGMKMSMNGQEHMMLMPGMLTEAQMRQLDQARGPEFDRLFLTSMIQHHKGAVSMVTNLFGSRGAAQDETVFKFANDVSVDQSTEIARMEKMLAGYGSAAGAP